MTQLVSLVSFPLPTNCKNALKNGVFKPGIFANLSFRGWKVVDIPRSIGRSDINCSQIVSKDDNFETKFHSGQ